MGVSRNSTAAVLLVVAVAWAAFAIFDFNDAGERGGRVLSNTRFIRALVASGLCLFSFVGFWFSRRPHATWPEGLFRAESSD